ncbi:iron-containing alcohol dehydrogenase family protein [Ensifer soli]|uniref:iron-containing alcohol dehydrogenase family protein n=1 Tax=Ciceribacter sp. sgz301302 TaxID=3342379 RepID=UPI0035BB5457
MDAASTYQITLPTKVFFGPGERRRLSEEAGRIGGRAFVMVDPFLKETPVERGVLASLSQAGVSASLWHDIVPNPRAGTCDRAAAELVEAGATMIVALGGGSTMDAAKAVALVAANGGTSWDYTARAGAQVRQPERRGIPLIAIPTNAGTGAEITPFAVLSHPDLHLKATIIHPFCFPDVALIDPDLHRTKPRRLTASTGVDTFLHAFEGYIGTRPSGWTDLFSLRAMELTAEWLPRACDDGADIEARTRMAEACYMAGITLGAIGVGIPHALGQALGALKDTPHGESCAAFLVETVRWTHPVAADRLATVAGFFGGGDLAGRLSGFFDRIGLDARLSRLGLARDETGRLLDIAEANYGFDIACSRKPAGRADLEAIVAASF